MPSCATWLLIAALPTLLACEQATTHGLEQATTASPTSLAVAKGDGDTCDGLRLLTSREYKLTLDPASFDGDRPDLAVAEFWSQLAAETVRPVSGRLGDVIRIRDVRFWDTPGTCALRRNGFVFRERVEDDQREVTLKHRGPDRMRVAGLQLGQTHRDAETKFEEDIAAPFVSSYGLSVTQPIGHDKRLNRMDDPLRLYPGLQREGFDEDEALGVVGDTTWLEVTFRDGAIDLGREDARFVLTLWYAPGGMDRPAVAEISFKVDLREGGSLRLARRAADLFTTMQQMTGWATPRARSKTAFAYGVKPGFCD